MVKRYSTSRLIVAASMSLTGAVIAVLLGMPELALFAAPWMVLCVFGLSQPGDVVVRVTTEIADERFMIGDTVELKTTVAVDSAAQVAFRPVPAATFGAGERAEDGVSTLTTVAVAAPGQPAEITTDLVASEWGTHDVGASSIRVLPPYRLFQMTGARHSSRVVRVHPTTAQLKELVAPWMVRRLAGTHASKESARGVEYADIREFAPGDSVRDINWRVSARSQDVWISQRHPDRATDVILLVDSFVESGHDVRTIFGLVVDSAVSLAEGHLAATDRVGLIEFGGVVRWIPPGTGSSQLQRITDALLATGLYANAADKELPILPPRALPPRSFVVAFTPLLDDRFIEAIITARARGHDVAVIECVAGAASGDPEESSEPLNASELITRRLWQAERAVLRDYFAEQGIAVASWDGDTHLDATLSELIRRRRVVRTGGR